MTKSSALLAIIVVALVAFCAGRFCYVLENKPAPVDIAQSEQGQSRTAVVVRKVTEKAPPPADADKTRVEDNVPQIMPPQPPHPVVRTNLTPPPPPENRVVPVPPVPAIWSSPQRSRLEPVPVPRPVDVLPLRFFSSRGSKVVISGTSNLKEWQLESSVISGNVEIVPAPKPEELPRRIYNNIFARITVRTFSAPESNHLLSRLDNAVLKGAFMEFLEVSRFPEISYRCMDLTVTNYTETGIWQCQTTGNVIAHGVTNQVEIPIEIVPLENTAIEYRIQIKGEAKLKMSVFKIAARQIKMNAGYLTPDDDVTVTINWELTSKR